jgi:hypothetical protein
VFVSRGYEVSARSREWGRYVRMEMRKTGVVKATALTFASDFDETLYPSFKLLHK